MWSSLQNQVRPVDGGDRDGRFCRDDVISEPRRHQAITRSAEKQDRLL
jgi:hypothetical protein